MQFNGAKIVKLARSKTLISNIYTNAMTLRRLFAEFIGTFFLALVVCMTTYSKVSAEQNIKFCVQLATVAN